MVGSNLRARTVDGAIARWRISGIAAGIRGRRSVEWRNAGRGIELRQSIERTIGKSVDPPILAHRPEVVIEGAILLRHEDNVIQNADCLVEIERRSHRSVRVHGHATGSKSLARACPAGKVGSSCGSGRELNDGASTE